MPAISGAPSMASSIRRQGSAVSVADVRLFPADDETFESTATSLLSGGNLGSDADALESNLRLDFPEARVSVRRSPGRCGGRIIWYLFRDGHFGG